jgi:beta-lactamase regulating signal transducer with metallopeptidase domain
MLENIVTISLSMSAVILLLLIISPLLNKRYSAKWRYFVWLILAVRLVIPVKFELPQAPVNIPVSNHIVVFRQEGIPVAIMDERYSEKGNASENPADYAPVITLQELLRVIWVIGASLFFLYHIISYFVFKRKIRQYCKAVCPEILCDVLNDVNIKSVPQLFQCGKVESPMMLGFFKPAILLPDTDYSNDETAVVIRHELAHYKRGDIWYKLLLIIANAMHWFNPFVYLMTKAANRDLEYSCDDIVIKNRDITFRKEYSLTILKAMQKNKASEASTYLNGGSRNE